MINKITRQFNLKISKIFPRHSIKFAGGYFWDKKINVIEVGVADGKNALNMLEELDIRRLFLVDNYSDPNYSYEKAKKRLEKHDKKLTWVLKDSKSAVRELPYVNLVYIDGNHEYKHAKEDMINYWELLKKNGVLAGHDINNNETGVPKAFFEFCKEYNLEPNISGSDWWVIKW